jgi:Carboxypeptidase regulatory-like domain
MRAAKKMKTKHNLRYGPIVIAFACLFTAVPSFAQSSAVSGHVVDSSGLPIPGVAIDIVSARTNEVQNSKTNDVGYYLFPPLNPGIYLIHVTAPHFAKATVENVTLEVGSSRVIDVTLQPESEAQSITVTASAPELVTDHADRGDVIESQFVQNTPLNIRNPLQLINFSQGVTTINALGSSSGNNNVSEVFSNAFRINGGKLATTENLLDGAANTTLYDFNGVADVPQVEAIEEFKVLTTAYAPEWGRTSGAIVTFATRSGTNEYHGSLFEYLRNSALDAAGFNANAAGRANPHFQRNQFGYAFGGPVLLPHLYDGKNRTFFYTTWEQLQQSQAGSFLGTVPTALERKGDFSQTKDANGNLIVIYNPTTTTPDPSVPAGYVRTAFPGNQIPVSMFNQVGVNVLSHYPLPNQPGQGASDVNNYFSGAATSSSQNTVDTRVDHRFSDSQSIFARFDWFQRFNNPADTYGNGFTPGLNHQRLPGYNAMLNHTWVISPATVFEHHFVYGHQESNRIPAGEGINPTDLGFNSNVSAGLRALNFPTVTSVNRISGLGPTSGLEADAGTILGYAASLSQLKGKHSLKYGFDFRYYPTDIDIAPLVTVTANANFTGGPNPQAPVGNSGSGIADLPLGAATVSSGFAPGYHFGHPYFAFYAQDTWAVTPRLTITYGLRYNLELPDRESHNQYVFLDLNTPSPLNSQVTSLGTLTGGPGFVGVNGRGANIQAGQLTDLDPRVGFAYRLGEKTVVRGGFGIFHAPPADLDNASAGFAVTTTSRAALADGVTPQLNLANPFPNGLTQPTGNSLGLATLLGQNITGVPRQEKISYSEQWSVDVQRELPGRFVLNIGYVGNHGLNLYAPVNYNQLPDADLALGSRLLAQVQIRSTE